MAIYQNLEDRIKHLEQTYKLSACLVGDKWIASHFEKASHHPTYISHRNSFMFRYENDRYLELLESDNIIYELINNFFEVDYRKLYK